MSWDVYTCERCGKAFVADRGGQPRHCVGCALQLASEHSRRHTAEQQAGREATQRETGHPLKAVGAAVSRATRALGERWRAAR